MTFESASSLRFWPSLPTELRLQILELVVEQRHPGWAACAAVCREWQIEIERVNFRHLRFRKCDRTGMDLNAMLAALASRRRYIRHLWIDLHPCPVSVTPDQHGWGPISLTRVTSEIKAVLGVVAKWRYGDGPITLQLTPYMPCDVAHWTRHHCHNFDTLLSENGGSPLTVEVDTLSVRELQAWYTAWYLPFPDWTQITSRNHNLSQDIHIGKDGDLPGFQTLLDEVPQLSCVQRLIVRRHLRRVVPPLDFDGILRSIPRLEELVYEPWKTREHMKAKSLIEYCCRMLRSLPPTLDRLSVFEDWNALLEWRAGDSLMAEYWGNPIQYMGLKLAKAFAQRSCSLQHLSISYMIDAEIFFRACQPDWVWERLESLALTYPFLSKHYDDDRVAGNVDAPPWHFHVPTRRLRLLQRAAYAALRMPRLSSMTIWTGKRGFASAFIYERSEHNLPSITWRGSWDLQLAEKHALVWAWRKVAAEHCVAPLHVYTEVFDKSDIASHADAISLLRLPREVTDSRSLEQIRREASLMPSNWASLYPLW